MQASPKKSRPRSALVVLTDAVNRQLVSDTLGSVGFRVLNSIESGSAAVTRARDQKPDIILLSQQLSDVSAREAVTWLRSNRESAATPIVIVGGDSANNPALDPKTTVLPRPVTGTRLRQALIDALGAEYFTHESLK